MQLQNNDKAETVKGMRHPTCKLTSYLAFDTHCIYLSLTLSLSLDAVSARCT